MNTKRQQVSRHTLSHASREAWQHIFWLCKVFLSVLWGTLQAFCLIPSSSLKLWLTHHCSSLCVYIKDVPWTFSMLSFSLLRVCAQVDEQCVCVESWNPLKQCFMRGSKGASYRAKKMCGVAHGSEENANRSPNSDSMPPFSLSLHQHLCGINHQDKWSAIELKITNTSNTTPMFKLYTWIKKIQCYLRYLSFP